MESVSFSLTVFAYKVKNKYNSHFTRPELSNYLDFPHSVCFISMAGLELGFFPS